MVVMVFYYKLLKVYGDNFEILIIRWVVWRRFSFCTFEILTFQGSLNFKLLFYCINLSLFLNQIHMNRKVILLPPITKVFSIRFFTLKWTQQTVYFWLFSSLNSAVLKWHSKIRFHHNAPLVISLGPMVYCCFLIVVF